MVKRVNLTKLFSSFLVILLALSLFNPMFVSADGQYDVVKRDELSRDKIEQMEDLVNFQESLLEREGEINPELKRTLTSSNEKVSVIVQLSEAPVELEKGKRKLKKSLFTASHESTIKRKIHSQQNSLVKEMDRQSIMYEEGYTYSRTINAVELKINTSDLEKLANIPGVVSVDPNEVMYALESNSDDEMDAHMIDSVPHLGVPEIWEGGNEGAGIKVGVIDSGIDYDHPDLKDVYKGGMNFVDHNDEDGTMYARDRDEDDPYETSPLDKPDDRPVVDNGGNYFYTSHGTHVAGIIAATGNNEYGIKGIAPKVDLHAYRVLGAYGSGMTTWVIAGIEQSVEDNMDVINLSLGGGSNSEEDLTSIAVNNATIGGTTVVSATGNSGPELGSIGTPATSPLGIAVGNSTLPEVIHSAEVHVEAGDYSHDSNITLMASTFGTHPSELTGEYDVVAIPNYGTPEDFEGIDVEGKVALISRGDIPFVDKIAAAKEAGAVVTIIHNNTGSGAADVSLGDSFDLIPSFDMKTEEGEALREALEEEGVGKVTFSDFSESETEGNEINDSSSRGPTMPNLDVKPDVVAPGTNIMSTVPEYGKDYPNANYDQAYDRKTGTSMAAPQVAGIAALLLAENEDWDPFDVKVSLTNTAEKLDTNKYDVFDQGAGLVQPAQAVSPNVLAYVQDTMMNEGDEISHSKGAVTFGRIAPDSNSEITVTKEIEVRNFSGDSEDFNVEIETTETGTGANISVDKSSFTLNGTETLEVTLTVDPGEDMPGNMYLGYINIIGENTSLSLPYSTELSVTSPTGLEYFYLDDDAISPDREGAINETRLNFGLYNEHSDVIIELWDPLTQLVTGDGYIGAFNTGAIPAGNFYLPIDGEYFSWTTGGWEAIPDGFYTIDFNDYSIIKTKIMDYVPFFVKRTLPEVQIDPIDEEIDDHNYTLTGTIDDQFVDFKGLVEESLGTAYNVNDYLTATYELADEDENVVDEGAVVLEQDGTFEIDLDNLNIDEHTLVMYVEDIAKNSMQEQIKLGYDDINISLSSSPTNETEGPVTISVETDSGTELTSLKWLEGEKTAEDFAEAGNDIDLAEMSFDVEENGEFTVYAKNRLDVEAVESITVDNIIEPEEPGEPEGINITLSPSTTEPTNDPVTVSVETNRDDLASAKWLEGQKTVEDFAEEGHEIDLETMAFDVEENNYYTVYVKDEDGEEAVQSITVLNILDPEQGDVTANLEPSTNEPTEEPVQVTINIEEDVESLKWLPGARFIKDFEPESDDSENTLSAANADSEEYGYEIDLETRTFEVTENGIYSVYAKMSDGERGVFLISVENIIEASEPEDPEEPEDPSDPEDPEEPEEPEAPEEFNVMLTPSTTAKTEGPVTIAVKTDSKVKLDSAQWLAGEMTAKDFADAGNEIDLDTMSFDVTENGIYTVYVLNTKGVYTVEDITISNIVAPKEPEDLEEFKVTLTPSTTDDTEGPVTVAVKTDSEASLESAKWLAGEMTAEDFADAGNEIDLDTMSFDVTENGIYTVYVLNSEGVYTVEDITISNIVALKDPQPKDPEPKEKESEKDSDDTDGTGEKLPKTATNFYNYFLLGMTLLMLGIGTTMYARRKKDLF